MPTCRESPLTFLCPIMSRLEVCNTCRHFRLHLQVVMALCHIVSEDVTSNFDYVFWFGDLNYRVDLDRQTANKCLSKADIMVRRK